jgi:hypothetical protein
MRGRKSESVSLTTPDVAGTGAGGAGGDRVAEGAGAAFAAAPGTIVRCARGEGARPFGSGEATATFGFSTTSFVGAGLQAAEGGGVSARSDRTSRRKKLLTESGDWVNGWLSWFEGEEQLTFLRPGLSQDCEQSSICASCKSWSVLARGHRDCRGLRRPPQN